MPAACREAIIISSGFVLPEQSFRYSYRSNRSTCCAFSLNKFVTSITVSIVSRQPVMSAGAVGGAASMASSPRRGHRIGRRLGAGPAALSAVSPGARHV